MSKNVNLGFYYEATYITTKEATPQDFLFRPKSNTTRHWCLRSTKVPCVTVSRTSDGTSTRGNHRPCPTATQEGLFFGRNRKENYQLQVKDNSRTYFTELCS